jgi:hypothetical protein
LSPSPPLRACSISCHNRGGESGNSVGWTFHAVSAAATALPMVAAVATLPPSLPPLTPSGLLGEGRISSVTARTWGKSVAVGTR